mmetsp:Transcript_53414/g.134171  ORF Transcript_53414/g.134171 Transcript_53414/m.134171 type:complete len:520 (-) Transcript_53414:78-1637(-)|eukprot:CAMPEP_0177659182 /NCGR_PEP_ID=MMETSP0447-20121125/17297_1 /TAXON_ID=0 /ORGANISM="Stygamoeba regulata, Strain BSH-02190019" /LENGTH=519 /DNA_ID=CAMNT_0019164017 /DNA_START=278 /DNA_END=1837 /DNA_ORIENTATION=-
MAEAFKRTGNERFQAGEYEEALVAYEQAINLEADNHVHYGNRAAALIELNRHADALADADKAISINPMWARGYYRRAKALSGLGRTDEAIDALQAGLAAVPGDTQLTQTLEEMRGGSGAAPSAAPATTTSSVRAGGSTNSTTPRGGDRAKANQKKHEGNQLFQAGDYDGALRLYEEAVALDPEGHIHYGNRAAAYIEKGRYDDALADAERAISLNPTWPRGYYRKAKALKHLNQRDEAVAALRAGLAVCPNDPQLTETLSELGEVTINVEEDLNNIPDVDEEGVTKEQKLEVFRILRCKTYYQVLQVDRNAKEDEIKENYRRLARLVHPDRNKAKGSDQAMKLLTDANETLSSSAKRAMYDYFVKESSKKPEDEKKTYTEWQYEQGNMQQMPGWMRVVYSSRCLSCLMCIIFLFCYILFCPIICLVCVLCFCRNLCCGPPQQEEVVDEDGDGFDAAPTPSRVHDEEESVDGGSSEEKEKDKKNNGKKDKKNGKEQKEKVADGTEDGSGDVVGSSIADLD